MRLLLKLSGEQLAGDSPRGFSVGRASWIADEIKKAKKESPDAEIVVIVGAGNFVRGAYFAGQHVRPVTADNMGMMGTMINAVALADVFNAEGLPTAALSNVSCQQIIDDYTHRRALSHLSKGRVVIVAGGTGRPYFTTDTSALNLAIELDCDVVAKATKVDGIFDDDPEKNRNARKLDTISYDDALRDKKVRVMDKAALALAAEHNKPVVVFELLKPGNIAKVASGQTVGTSIK
jgi:uridylate kinase